MPEKVRIRLDLAPGSNASPRVERIMGDDLWHRAQELVRHPQCRERLSGCSHDDPLPDGTFRLSGDERIASFVTPDGQWAALISRSGTRPRAGFWTFELGFRMPMSYYVELFPAKGGPPIASAEIRSCFTLDPGLWFSTWYSDGSFWATYRSQTELILFLTPQALTNGPQP
jgi:hypothetical protein